MQNSKNSHSLLMRMQNGTLNLEDSLAISFKAKYNFTIHSSNQYSEVLIKLTENKSTQNFHMKIIVALFITTQIRSIQDRLQ